MTPDDKKIFAKKVYDAKWTAINGTLEFTKNLYETYKKQFQNKTAPTDGEMIAHYATLSSIKTIKIQLHEDLAQIKRDYDTDIREANMLQASIDSEPQRTLAFCGNEASA